MPESRWDHGTLAGASDKAPLLCQRTPGVSMGTEVMWIWMQCRTECGKPSSALMPIYKLVLGACLAFRFSEGHWGDAGRGSPVLTWKRKREKKQNQEDKT